MGAVIAGGPRERIEEQAELPFTTDKRRLQPCHAARLRRHLRAGPKGAKCNKGLGFAFGSNRFARLVLDDVACEALRQLADDDLAWLSPLLQAGRNVDGVAADHELAILTSRGDSLAGIDSNTHRQVGRSVPDLD